MTEPSTTADAQPAPLVAQAPSTGSVVMGLLFIGTWLLAHVILYYLLAVSAFLVDLFLGLLRAVMFPGASPRNIDLAWTVPLTVGLALAGAAGIPAGLAIFMRARRKQLLRGFWITLALGIVFEGYAAFSLISNAFSG